MSTHGYIDKSTDREWTNRDREGGKQVSDNFESEDEDDLVPQKYLDMINMEYLLHPDEVGHEEKTSIRLMRESLPHVTASLVRMALRDPDSRVRLNATNTIMDRVLGKAGVTSATETSPQEQLYGELMEEVDRIFAEHNA